MGPSVEKGGTCLKRYELSGTQWRRIEGFLPGRPGHVGGTARDNQQFVDGVLWVLRSGAHWQDMPATHGNWKSAHKRFTRWAQAGIWERFFRIPLKDPENQWVMIDSTSVRVHQQAVCGKGGAMTRLWGVPEVA